MFIEFTVGNYRSFKTPVTFSMVAAKISARDKSLDANNVFQAGNDLRLLKSAAIYGANASGKSNLLAASRFMREFVLNSSRATQAADPIDVEHFRLSTTTENEPSLFEIVFLLEERQYRYGFEVNRQRVIAEWLFYVPNVRETLLFERHLDSYQLSTVFKEGRGIEPRTRKNALFLSVVAQFNGALAQKLLHWFSNVTIVSGIQDFKPRLRTIRMMEDDDYKEEVVNLAKKLDLNIEDVHLDKQNVKSPFFDLDTFPERHRENYDAIEELVRGVNTRIMTRHRKYDEQGRPIAVEDFDMDHHESEGTRKIIELSGLLLEVLHTGQVLIIDELDARLHPLITQAIITLFNSNETNAHNAQLIFTTHDTNLLSNRFFRRDQIWFIEKDRLGATHLASLVEYRVRNDASFEKDYIEGRYGAIPFIGDLREMIGELNA